MADDHETAPVSPEPPAGETGGESGGTPPSPGGDTGTDPSLRPGAGAPLVSGPPRSVRAPIRASRLNAVLGVTGVVSILAIIAAVVIVVVIVVKLIRG